MFDEGIQSYFGESDSNFFGDTSNDMIFGEGYGEQAVDGAQFFSEAVGFSSDGGEFISEATAFDTETGDYFTEGGDGITYAGAPALKPEENPVALRRKIPNTTDPALTKKERHEMYMRKHAAEDKASDRYDVEGDKARRKAAAPFDDAITRSKDQGYHTKYGMKKVMRRTDNNQK